MTPKPRLRSQQARSELTVQHILEATFLLIKSEKKLNMQSIADRAGVSIGTVYHHFESKSDLMTAAFSAYLDDVYEQIFRACTKPAGMRKPLLKTMFREAFTYLQTSVCVRSFLARPPASAEQAWMEFANRTATLMATSLADAEKEQEMILIKGLIRARLEGVRSMLVSTSLGRHQSMEEITPSLVNILVEFCETGVRPFSGTAPPSAIIANAQQPKG
ncbi:MAG: TetR/AcrR family transcriptional regulator [Hyphomonas sp.]|nr:TetR/AcrR family transcriptional regulator [Hyphomonas sp.]